MPSSTPKGQLGQNGATKQIGMWMRYEFKGASLVLTQIGNVVQATYSGPMTTDAFNVLRSKGIGRSVDYAAAVIDVRAVVPLGLDLQEVAQHRMLQKAAPPGAFVVNPDQYAFWSEYAILGARLGYARAVFVSYAEGLEWAQDMAACTVDFPTTQERNTRTSQVAGPSFSRDPEASQADELVPTAPAPLV